MNRRRIHREPVPPPLPVRLRMIWSPLFVLVVIGWIGRRILRLRLNA